MNPEHHAPKAGEARFFDGWATRREKTTAKQPSIIGAFSILLLAASEKPGLRTEIGGAFGGAC